MTQIETSSHSTHGAGWLLKLMGLAQGVLVIVIVLMAFWLVVSFPVWWSAAPRLPLPLLMDLNPSPEILSMVPENTKLLYSKAVSFNGIVDVKFESAWVQWLYILALGLEIILYFLIVRALRQIVGSISKDQAFGHQNAKRLRLLGVLFLVDSIFEPGISFSFSKWAVGSFVSSGGVLVPSGIPDSFLPTFITGWVLLILSEVFRQGTEMTQEQSLTI